MARGEGPGPLAGGPTPRWSQPWEGCWGARLTFAQECQVSHKFQGLSWAIVKALLKLIAERTISKQTKSTSSPSHQIRRRPERARSGIQLTSLGISASLQGSCLNLAFQHAQCCLLFFPKSTQPSARTSLEPSPVPHPVPGHRPRGRSAMLRGIGFGRTLFLILLPSFRF